MNSLIKGIFDLAGSLICHQLPERSLTAGNLVLPVCARDTGIYAGIFTSFAYLIITRRLNAQRPPRIAAAVAMTVMMVPMMIDGALSYAGLIETNNIARLFTGLFFGLPIPILLVPAANFSSSGQNNVPVLKKWSELMIVYTTGILICVLLLHGLVPYFAAGFIYVAGLLALISRIIYTLVCRTITGSRRRLRALTALGSASTLVFLYLLSAYILQPLKDVLFAR
ncbi:MAG TPA: DUF2085 domain-containing protein [Clostridiales bacterium]|nr:DUF2085 domain-containing protein [Clostridiales bacterium]HQD30289.1 DUF2085 domain-containing protein [Clostridiales bacterium]